MHRFECYLNPEISELFEENVVEIILSNDSK